MFAPARDAQTAKKRPDRLLRSMCLLLLSRNHPDYDLILLSNRDEFFERPTKSLTNSVIEPSALSLTIGESRTTSILSGLDAERGGTWLALSKTGKFSALTNFHTPGTPPPSPISRGHLPLSFLTSSLHAREFTDTLIQDERITQVGGFSLLCGDLSRLDEGVVVAGNHSQEAVVLLQSSHNEHDVFGDRSSNGHKTKSGMIGSKDELMCACELSNTSVTTPWPKTRLGKKLLEKAMQQSTRESWSRDKLINSLIDVLSTNTMETQDVAGMRNSIFIPRVQVRGDWYGTRQHTVWLVKGKDVHLVEETILQDDTRHRVVIDHEIEDN